MLPLSDHDRLDRLEREIAVRLYYDEDVPEIVKFLGATPEQVGRVRDALPGMEE